MSAIGDIGEIKAILADDLYREVRPARPGYAMGFVSPGGWRVDAAVVGGRCHVKVERPDGSYYARSEIASAEWLNRVLP